MAAGLGERTAGGSGVGFGDLAGFAVALGPGADTAGFVGGPLPLPSMRSMVAALCSIARRMFRSIESRACAGTFAATVARTAR